MGCSSGRLHERGIFEPSGVVTSYLIGGAVAVVGNLWDVTDKDIDRFTVALIRYMNDEISLDVGVVRARDACKLPYLIGAAAVCYGVPVKTRNNNRSSNDDD